MLENFYSCTISPTLSNGFFSKMLSQGKLTWKEFRHIVCVCNFKKIRPLEKETVTRMVPMVKNNNVGEFAALLADGIRNPLNAIMLHLTLLKRSQSLLPGDLEHLRIIYEEALKVDSFVSKIVQDKLSKKQESDFD
jgi:signal transduction histidine kinase